GMPPAGNSFGFASQRLGNTVRQIQEFVLSRMPGQENAIPTALMQKIYSIHQPVSSYVVGRNTAPGWITIGHGTQQPANAVVLPLVIAPTAILAGLTLSALANAKGKAQAISCVNNLKQMGLVSRIYATDNHDSFTPDFL